MSPTAQLTERTTEATRSDELRMAELIARTGLEPDLAERYVTDPVSVLAEFGLSAAEPVYLSEQVSDTSEQAYFNLMAARNEPMGVALQIDDLNHFHGQVGFSCISTDL